MGPVHDETAFAKTAFAKTDRSSRGHWTSASRTPLPATKPSSPSTALPPAQLTPAQQEAIQRMTEVLVRRQYAYTTGSANPPDITKADIEQHLLARVRDEGLSESSQNGIINAIKFYYEKVLDHERIKRPVMAHMLRHSFATARQRGPLTPLPRHGRRHGHPLHPGSRGSELDHHHGTVPTRVIGAQAGLAAGHPRRVVADISPKQ